MTTKTRTKSKAKGQRTSAKSAPKKQAPKRSKRVVDTSFEGLSARYDRAVTKELRRLAAKGPNHSLVVDKDGFSGVFLMNDLPY